MAVTSKKTHPRNRAIGPLVNRLTKSQLYSKKALYKRPHKPIPATKVAEVDYAATKTVKVFPYLMCRVQLHLFLTK
jgi:hypothetical protein